MRRVFCFSVRPTLPGDHRHNCGCNASREEYPGNRECAEHQHRSSLTRETTPPGSALGWSRYHKSFGLTLPAIAIVPEFVDALSLDAEDRVQGIDLSGDCRLHLFRCTGFVALPFQGRDLFLCGVQGLLQSLDVAVQEPDRIRFVIRDTIRFCLFELRGRIRFVIRFVQKYRRYRDGQPSMIIPTPRPMSALGLLSGTFLPDPEAEPEFFIGQPYNVVRHKASGPIRFVIRRTNRDVIRKAIRA